MKPINQLDHKSTLEQNAHISDVNKSGFNLTHNMHTGGIAMGRMYPHVHFLMPGDKCSGSTESSLTFERIVTPVIGDVDLSIQNFAIPNRAVDRDFADLLTPTKLNSFAAGYHTPSFTLNAAFRWVASKFQNVIPQITNRHFVKPDWVSSESSFMARWNGQLTSLIQTADSVYRGDIFADLSKQLWPLANAINTATTAATIDAATKLYLVTLYDFWIGEGSNMDYLGMPIIDHASFSTFIDRVLDSNTGTGLSWSIAISMNTLYNYISDIPICEYELRKLYAIWFEHFRPSHYMPRSASLPDYMDFGSSPLLVHTAGSSANDKYWICFLPLHVRCWSKDAFNTAGIDDISRHVFAPIMSDANTGVSHVTNPNLTNYDDTLKGQSWSSLNIPYRDNSGVVRTVNCPLPSSFMSFMIGSEQYEDELSLDLNALKKSYQFENYLKRIFYGGEDEYRDRMESLYSVRIDDYNLLRPQWLSGSVSTINRQQEVANVSTAEGNVGDRTATATTAAGGDDGFTYFATEFGSIITLFMLLPRPQYDVTLIQNFANKTFDFPVPQFANSNEEIISTLEVSRNGFTFVNHNVPFGYAPYGHAYRYRVDEVHGHMLSSKFDYTFARFYDGLTSDGLPKLNYQLLHCRPNLPMFADPILLDGQAYGSFKFNFLVERELPVPVEQL